MATCRIWLFCRDNGSNQESDDKQSDHYFLENCTNYNRGDTAGYEVLSYQLKLIKMRAKLASVNHCAVPFLSRAVVNLCRYYYSKS